MSDDADEKRREYLKRRAAIAKAWREKNKEKWEEYMRKWRETHREKLRESYKRTYYKQKAMEAEQYKEERLELENCPKCDSAATIKPVSTGYAVGCTSEKCGLWVGRQFCHTFGTAEKAAETWNEFVREALDGKEEADAAREIRKRQKKEQAAMAPQGEDVKETIEEQEPAGTPYPTEPEEKGMRKKKVVEEEAVEEVEETEAAAEEEAVEEGEAEETVEDVRYTRFELVLDGVRYALDVEEDGCDGCAFLLSFGRRSICAASAEADMAQARTLCEALGFKWRKTEEDE